MSDSVAALAARFRTRFSEIEASLANLVDPIPESRAADPAYLEYMDCLPATRVAVLEHAVEAIELGERQSPEIPAPVLTAPRLAARCGVPLDVVLRRYSAANAFLVDILVEEAERVGVSTSTLRRLLRLEATVFDRLLQGVSEEHVREANNRPATTAEWRHRYLEELLAGRQPSGEIGVDYDFDGQHLGLMVKGEGAHEAMRALAAAVDRRLLADPHQEAPAWACWLGGGARLDPKEVVHALDSISPESVVAAVGEPADGIAGWRLSHRQAKAALPIAERKGAGALRYADVAVLASILRDDLGTTSLSQIYLQPLEATKDGGKVGRETLRAYFACERNTSSTAAALGVDRRTVTNRLRGVEELFGRPLGTIAAQLETALQLAE
jgi:PucR-like helix-turn-helix protein/diguanylate cyclase with GGDEF domain